jgi:hypothetical protein
VALVHAIEDFIAAHNEERQPFDWQESPDEILAAISRFAARTLDACSAHVPTKGISSSFRPEWPRRYSV